MKFEYTEEALKLLEMAVDRIESIKLPESQ